VQHELLLHKKKGLKKRLITIPVNWNLDSLLQVLLEEITMTTTAMETKKRTEQHQLEPHKGVVCPEARQCQFLLALFPKAMQESLQRTVP